MIPIFLFLSLCVSHFNSGNPSDISQITTGMQEEKGTKDAIVKGVPYDLDKPNLSFQMPEGLEEISGISISSDGQSIWAVQDENGLLFKLQKTDGRLKEEIKFHKDGDYEGVEMVGDVLYVVKSTGTVYRITKVGAADQKMDKFNYFLSRENDVEGLGYDAKNNCLLLACKGIPATGESFDVIRNKKVVYAFDLNTHTLNPVPAYTLEVKAIRDFLAKRPTMKSCEKLKEFFSPGKENLTFNPSAIAIHPTTGDNYILSSVGKVLIVLDQKGEIQHIEKMTKVIHRQPEGIAFDKDGTLYIANEGKGGPGKILVFRRQ